jgi:hypothetical protein
MRNRADELSEIDRYIAQRGVTRSPERFVGAVIAALPPQLEAARIASITVEPPLTAAERIALVKRQLRALFR